ncbi:sarcosine oxidase subunit delta (plasmid) [Acinetobacter sp. ANC 7454]|uniref:Sarcosine oxidase subunit delta n=1 Tax=Acinetobacter baumannii TaxID=470 RepID=A0A9Q8P1G3_ACIBA|nr:sarcosine oxidase subunit delta [Acinetobacter sp. HR7]KGT48509.1 sarcosine oxidase, subunit delta [Acinetobacter sp. HR7]UAA86669.1 sarcosine oxidase subunit delta [Acinetobacter baumannii]
MKIMICPLNGPRNISEFTYGGEVREMPDQNTCTDQEWADYVFNKDNLIGVVREWWMHTPSSYWFIAERHTATDEILRTYDPKEIFNKRIEFTNEAQTTTSAAQQGVGA